MDGVMGCLVAQSGRHDHLDGHTYEMRQAMSALTKLYELHDTNPLFAQVMLYSHVLCGEEARRLADTWVTLALMVTPRKKRKGPLPVEHRSSYAATGLALYASARSHWSSL